MSQPLRLLSWNLGGLNDDTATPRAEAACFEVLLGASPEAVAQGAPARPIPDVLALQEVLPTSFQAALRPHLRAAGFELVPDLPPADREVFELLAVRPPWRVSAPEHRPFSWSPLGRGAVGAHLASAGGQVTVWTGHLESLRSGHGPRLDQVAEIDRWMARQPPSIFLGDTNLRDQEWSELEAQVAMVDAALSIDEPSPTWWPEESDRGFRFDRVWLSPEAGFRVLEVTTRARPRISDHAALEALVELSATGN